MSVESVNVPDVGGAEDVEVIEVCVRVGDSIAQEDSLVVLESDKASMEIPSPFSGTITAIHIGEGDRVSEGSALVDIELADSEAQPEQADEGASQPQPADADQAAPQKPKKESAASKPAAAAAKEAAVLEQVLLPDIGDENGAEVIELPVAVGDSLQENDTIAVLESDKASMDVPSPFSGLVKAVHFKVGDNLKQGDLLLDMEVDKPAAAPVANNADNAGSAAQLSAVVQQEATKAAGATAAADTPVPNIAPASSGSGAVVYAGPAVRKIAREFGIDLTEVKGSGPRGRLLKEDLQNYVKNLTQKKAEPAASAIPPIPEVDFAAFGEVDIQKLSRLEKLISANMSRNWLNVPHVSHMDDADLTELEEYRASMKPEMKKRGVKLSPLPFLIKAVATTLMQHPKFNASLHHDGEHIVYKKYCHVGMAVDTPAGLVVPVIKNADKKSIWEIGGEVIELADKARQRKLGIKDMQGACFSISSLGNIGGTGFTPIVNAPEVAILGVSRLAMLPRYQGVELVPRKILPLTLSYDHRVINGGDAGRFMTALCELLADAEMRSL